MFFSCEVELASGEPAQILQRIERRILDCAVLPMPVENDRFQVQQIARSPLVICMRSDDTLAAETRLEIRQVAPLIKIFPDPQAHPAGYARLVELFRQLDLPMHIACSASTPTDIQWMVKAGYGLALVDQLTELDADLTTRPLMGVDWTVDIAFVHRNRLDHIALPFLERLFTQRWRYSRPKKHSDRVRPEQIKLRA